MYTWIIAVASVLCTVSIIYLYRSVKKVQSQEEFVTHIMDAWRSVARSTNDPNVQDYE